MNAKLTRRAFLRAGAAAALGAGIGGLLPYRSPVSAAQGVIEATGGRVRALRIRREKLSIAGRDASVTAINGSLPGPLLRFLEDETVTIRVTNEMDETTSIHWHGLLVPYDMDGVPGVSFPGIEPGETFTYRYTLRQSGTYWYHSHSGQQEQSGVYGPVIVDPAQPEPFAFDRDYVVMLSDWTFEDPRRVLAKLKKVGSYYNFQQRTIGDFFRDVARDGWRATLSERLLWARMRMNPTDIADVTGYTYTYLINGLSPDLNWTGLFAPGQRVRLRFINAGAMTHFDVRIPGLEMTVVQADGQNVQPVTVEEFRIAPAETYDVVVQPSAAQPYTILAETMDRSGYASASLAPRPGMRAPIPARRSRPVRTMVDMGMAPTSSESMTPGMPGMEGSAREAAPSSPHGAHGTDTPAAKPDASAPSAPAMHGPDTHGPGNSMIAMTPVSRLGEPGIGLDPNERRVLLYTDLRRLVPDRDTRPAEREIEWHLTGNMERQMWSIDGKKYSEATQPIPFRYGERLRIMLINDTMMDHPMHQHGMWMVLDNGAGSQMPYKHTINVKAGEKLSFIVTPDEPGPFAFHCHLFFHMELGMFRVVAVSSPETGISR